MDRNQLRQNAMYLIDKYTPDRDDLKKLLTEDIGSIKYILAQIEKDKSKEYDNADLELIQDIVFYYV